MALQNSDLFLVERGGVNHQMSADQLADFLGAVKDHSVSAFGDLGTAGSNVGDRIFVVDASADPQVASGWAIYRHSSTGPNVFDKVQEQESMDVVVVVNLGYTPGATSGTITNSAGDTAVIPSVNETEAGLATPAMLNNSHVAASAAGTATTNPITVNGAQEVNLSIGQLLALP